MCAAYGLMEELRKARAEPRLDLRMRVYLALRALIVDELDIWSYDRDCKMWAEIATEIWSGWRRAVFAT